MKISGGSDDESEKVFREDFGGVGHNAWAGTSGDAGPGGGEFFNLAEADADYVQWLHATRGGEP